MSIRGIRLGLALALLWVCWAGAVTRNVPGNYPTIQSGINAANIHDTVLVAEGTYHEQIDFLGKAIRVASYYITDDDIGHVERTTIVATYAGRPETLSAVLFINGETSESQLQGFTVAGGDYTYVPPHEEVLDYGCGGAVFCGLGNPTISDCYLQGDVCGAYPDGNPTFINCTMGVVEAYDWKPRVSLAACSTGAVYTYYGGSVGARHSNIGGSVNVGIGCGFSIDSGSVTGDLTVYRGGASVDYSRIGSVSLEMDGGISIDHSIVSGSCVIWGWNGLLEVDNSTVLGGIAQSSEQGQLWVSNSIVSTHLDTAINSGGGYLHISCVVIDTTADVPVARNMEAMDTAYIFHASPRFCDPAGEFAIRDNSICAPSNNACNQLIGAGEVGCLCCIGVRGNANGLEGIDLTDLSTLILYLVSARGTVTGDWCPSEANVDSKGIIDVSDLSYLISYLTSPPGTVTLLPCPYSSLASLRSGPGVRPRVEP